MTTLTRDNDIDNNIDCSFRLVTMTCDNDNDNDAVGVMVALLPFTQAEEVRSLPALILLYKSYANVAEWPSVGLVNLRPKFDSSHWLSALDL